jgi:RNA ligase (TIGR02306 family)
LELAEPEEFVPGTVLGSDGIERPKQENTFWKVARELDLSTKLAAVGYNICLQGELIGEGIQGNPYKIKGQTVKFFNAFNIDTQEYLGLRDFVAIITLLGLDHVPILDAPFQLPETVDEMLKYAEGYSYLNPQTQREGVVVRSLDRTISFKAISNQFLLAEK